MSYEWVNSLSPKEVEKLASFMLKIKHESVYYPRVKGLVDAISWTSGDDDKTIITKLCEAVTRINEGWAKGAKEWRSVMLDAYNLSNCAPYLNAKRHGVCPELAWGKFSPISAMRSHLENERNYPSNPCVRRRGLPSSPSAAGVLEIAESLYSTSYYAWDNSSEGRAAWNSIANAISQAAEAKLKKKREEEISATLFRSPRGASGIGPGTPFGSTAFRSWSWVDFATGINSTDELFRPLYYTVYPVTGSEGGSEND